MAVKRRTVLTGASALALTLALEGTGLAKRRRRRRPSGTASAPMAVSAPKGSGGLFNMEGISLPAPRFVTAPGRLRRGGKGWERTPQNEARSYNGGILLEGAERVRSARWDTSNAASALSASDGSISAAGTHATADIFGGTGRCTLWQTAGNTARLVADGLAEQAQVGAPCRALFTFHIEPGASDITLMVRIEQNGRDLPQLLELTFDGTGTLANAAKRGGGRQVALSWQAELLDTVAGGRKVYTAWLDIDATANGAVAPALVVTGPGSARIAIHGVNLMVDPLLKRPSLLPILEDGAVAADRLDFGVSSALEVEFEAMAMGRTRVSANAVTVPDFMAAPGLPLETRVTLRPASEARTLAYLLPSDRWELDAWPAAKGEDRVVTLGAGYFEYAVALGSFPQPVSRMGRYTLQGAFADPVRWPQVKGLVAHASRISALTLENVCLFGRTSKGTHETELAMQTPVLTASLSTLRASRFRMRGCNTAHSRSWAETEDWMLADDARDQLWFGEFNTPVLPDGFDWQLADGEISHLCNGQTISTADPAHTGRYVQQGVYSHDIVVDHINTGRGTISWLFRNNIFGRSTNLVGSGYHSEAPIEVDVGGGRVPLANSGLAVRDLPVNRLFTLYGRRDEGSGPIIAGPDSNWSLRVTSWQITKQLQGAREGYGFFASIPSSAKDSGGQMERDLAVWVHRGTGPASRTNPHIFVTTQLGKTDAAGLYQRGKLPAAGSARLHSDCLQVNGQGGVFDMELDGNFFLSEGQTMLFGGTSSAGPNPTRFTRLVLDGNIACSGAFDACSIYGLPVANADVRNMILLPVTGKRMQNSFGWYSASGEGVTMTLTNCWVGVNNKPGTANHSGKRTLKGGIINGDPKPIACNWRDGEGKLAYARERSTLPQLSDLVPAAFLDRNGLIKPGQVSDRTFHFTPAAEKLTGIPLNRTLSTCRGHAHASFGPLNALLKRFDRKPDRSVTVSGEKLGAGEAILSGLSGKAFDRLWGGNTRGLFALSGGTLRAARSLSGVNDVFLLVSDTGEHVLVDVRAG